MSRRCNDMPITPLENIFDNGIDARQEIFDDTMTTECVQTATKVHKNQMCYRYGACCPIPCPIPPVPVHDLDCYGGLYAYGPQTLILEAHTPLIIPMDRTYPAHGLYYRPEDSVTVKRAGVYEIDYSITASTTSNGTITLAVYVNGIPFPYMEVSRYITSGVNNFIGSTALIRLKEGDIVNIHVSCSDGTHLIFTGGTCAQLILKKID